MNNLIVSACPRPYDAKRIEIEAPCGSTVDEVVALAFPDTELHGFVEVMIGDYHIPRKMWPYVRPKIGTVVTVNLLPGDQGALRIALVVAVTIAAIVATFFAPYGTPAYWAAVGVVVAGSVALALLPPPVQNIDSGDSDQDSQTYSFSQARNSFKPGGPVPQLFGKFRFAAPKAGEYVETSGGQTYIRLLLVLSTGLTTNPVITLGETPLDEFFGVETEFKRGWHPDIMTYQGEWNASSGSFPVAPEFGDRWVVNTGGTVDAVEFAAGDSIIRNHIGDGTTADGWDLNHDKPSALFPSDVYPEGLSVQLLYNSSIVRTSQINADELAVTITFNGLIQYNSKGKKRSAAVDFRIEYSPTGEDSWVNLGSFHIQGRQASPLFWSHRWKVNKSSATNGQFDVRVTRLTVANPTSDNQFVADSYWSRLDTFTMENAIGGNVGFTTLAIRILASSQLSGALDSVYTECQSIEREWDSGSASWVWGPTSSPAAHFRQVLQQPARPAGALADSRLDLDRLAAWSESNQAAGRTFDGYIDFSTTEFRILEDIAASGFASLTTRGTKYAVVVDEPKSAAVRLFSPRNTSNYRGKMFFAEEVHGYRIAFLNAAKGYTADYVVAYADGFDINNAHKIEDREYLGLTTQTANWLRARRDLAEAKLRRELHTVNTALLSVCCERGDKVALQHYAISVGISAGRIRQVA